MRDTINEYLNIIGIDFPSNEEELNLFNDIHVNYDHEANEESIDPYKILRGIKEEEADKAKTSGQAFHKRIVLAAEIVYQLQNDNYLGHLKLQKMIFLCQNILNMALPTNYLKQAMGPYDPRLMRSIDSQFEKREWFKFRKNEFPKYKTMGKVGGHKEWYEIYFHDQIGGINSLINLFRNFKTSQIELVSTIYACWLDGLKNNAIINDAFLMSKVYSWHESKKKFTEKQIANAILWMRENKIYPSK